MNSTCQSLSLKLMCGTVSVEDLTLCPFRNLWDKLEHKVQARFYHSPSVLNLSEVYVRKETGLYDVLSLTVSHSKVGSNREGQGMMMC